MGNKANIFIKVSHKVMQYAFYLFYDAYLGMKLKLTNINQKQKSMLIVFGWSNRGSICGFH